MHRIKERFDLLKKSGKKALITFITAGDPTLLTTRELIFEMEKRGADIIELGIPYSDPIAEGQVIQTANQRALQNDINIKMIINEVAKIRGEVSVPLVFLLYFNVIFKYGKEEFFKDCKDAGVDGVIIPDLPFEEKDELEDISKSYAVDIISLVAPTSRDRIKKIVEEARGFLYCVSSLGVTGVRKEFSTDFDDFFTIINKYCKIPKAIGFGISTSEQVKQLKGYADGLIVGSAIVKKVGESKSLEEAKKSVGDFVEELRKAMDEKKTS